MFLKLQKSFLCWLYAVHNSKQNSMQDNCQMILSNFSLEHLDWKEYSNITIYV